MRSRAKAAIVAVCVVAFPWLWLQQRVIGPVIRWAWKGFRDA